MMYVLFNEVSKKVVVTKSENKMFDLLIGDCIMIGTVKSEKEVEKLVAEFWINEVSEERVVS